MKRSKFFTTVSGLIASIPCLGSKPIPEISSALHKYTCCSMHCAGNHGAILFLKPKSDGDIPQLVQMYENIDHVPGDEYYLKLCMKNFEGEGEFYCITIGKYYGKILLPKHSIVTKRPKIFGEDEEEVYSEKHLNQFKMSGSRGYFFGMKKPA